MNRTDRKKVISAEAELFLHLLRLGVTETPAEEEERSALLAALTVNGEGALRLAAEHQLLPLVYDTMCREKLTGELPKEMAAEYRERSVQTAIRQITQTNEFLTIMKHLTEEGMRPLVLKGIICRNLYPKPMLRPSVDEDLLASPADAARLHERLLAEGLSPDDPEAEPENAAELSYHREKSPTYIELHLMPFPADSKAYGSFNRFFDGAVSRAVPVQAEDVELLTLHPTDHMLFLLLHALKHFLHSGVGIRQLTDMVLFAQNYGPEIDWTHVEHALREANGFSFARALFAIGEQYLMLDRGRAHLPDTWGGAGIDPADLLLDMISGGDMGTADLNRMHASSLTLEAVNADRAGRKNRGIFTALFPPLSGMQARFPYLRKRPYFLPAAYVQRIILYLMGRNSSSGPQPDRVLKIGEMRTALLREYEIIDTDRS